MKSKTLIKQVCCAAVAIFILIAGLAGPGVCNTPSKVAVIPFAMNSPQDLSFLQNGLFSMLSSRLADPGKVDVLDRETVDKAVAQAQAAPETKGALNESKARILGGNLGVDYILFGSLTHFGESVSLDASMVDVTGAKPTLAFFEQSNKMGDVIPLVNTFAGDINKKVFNRSIDNELYVKPEAQDPPAPGGLQYADGRMGQGGFMDMQRAGKGFATHLKYDGVITAMAAGDVDNDGIVEVVACTDYAMEIYQMQGNVLVAEKKQEFSSVNRIISLDIADINKNGRPEIFVTSLSIHRDHLISFVLEYNGSAYTTLVDGESYYYRVIDGPDDTPVLLGQRTSAEAFKGRIYTMSPSGKRYKTDKRLRMPRSVNVLSLAKGPAANQELDEFVFINEHGRLSIASDTGTVNWEGNQKYGGTENYFLLPRSDADASFTERVYFHPRLKFYDVNKDGKKEIIAVANAELGGGAIGRYKRFTKGRIEFLSWNGIALSPVLQTRPVQGWVSDFAVADVDGDGVNELIAVVVGKAKLLIGASRTTNIISYDLE